MGDKKDNIFNPEAVETDLIESNGYISDRGNSAYTTKLISFFNARHFVAFGSTPGPVHGHTWQFHIDIKVPPESIEQVAFHRIMEPIKSVLSPYEDTVLNHSFPFTQIQPTTENISMYFFNRIDEALKDTGLYLGRLTVWETPTRGVEVTSRYPGFDNLVEERAGAVDKAAEESGGSYGEAGDLTLEAEVSASPREAAADEIDSALDETAAAAEEVDGEAATAKLAEMVALRQSPPGLTGSMLYNRYSLRRYALGACIITLAALLAYYKVLLPPFEQHYPWGSDSWGHLFKAEFLYKEILKGNFYPQFTEYWYNGSQPFRYWAPLPYYFLALLRSFTSDIFIAGNYYIFLCALLGGLSWLFFARRMGFWPAVLAGLVWLIWQDNVRVAFSEGNLPRVLATALLPLLFITLLKTLENRRSIGGMLGVAALVHLVVLCHAMIGAIYCICLSMFIMLLWVFRGCSLRDCRRGLLTLAAGVASSAWWLLPSLTGGITEIDAQAVKDIIQFVPARVSLDPLYRFTNRETFYWGFTLIAALVATGLTWKSKPPWAKSLAVCGVVLVLITFPAMRILFISLPLSHLMWPLRFTSFAALALLASALAFNRPEQRQRRLKSTFATGVLILCLFAAFFGDSWMSLRELAYTGTKSFSVVQSAEYLKGSPCWRVATIDLSRLGSAPSYIFSENIGAEQVFGWAWQGAVTSNNIMLLNTGLEMQYYPFLFRSCVNLGATELIVKDDVVKDPESFNTAASRAGYQPQVKFSGISIWNSLDSPYMVEKKNRCLVVGRYAGTIVMQFPEAEMGGSRYIDDYSLEELKQYPAVIYSGAEWRSKGRAEELVVQYAAAGGKAFVELGGMPKNVLAKQPEFLGVYGETVLLREPLTIFGPGRSISLLPFSPEVGIWKTYVPQVLDEVELEFDYYGNQAPIYGYKLVEGQKIYFLGGNLTYHALLTKDKAAVGLLNEILGLSPEYPQPQILPLTNYQATGSGYKIGYQADRDLEVIVPIAAMDGLRVELDGESIPHGLYENLLLLKLPAGQHEVTMTLEKTAIYRLGLIVSLLSLLIFAAFMFVFRKAGEKL